jgi:hypothetical protein
MMTVTDWLGFGAVVAAAMAFLFVLLWFGGRSRDVEPRVIVYAMFKVFGSIALAVAIGAAGRTVVGGPVLDVGAHTGNPLGVWVAPLRAHQTAVGVICLLLMAVLFLFAMTTVRSIVQGPVPFDDEADSNGSSEGHEE